MLLLLQLQLARVHVGAVPGDASEATAAGEEGLQLLALQVGGIILLLQGILDLHAADIFAGYSSCSCANCKSGQWSLWGPACHHHSAEQVHFATKGHTMHVLCICSCLQAYVIPDGDVRYITTFGGVEGAAMLTQMLSYSSRFSAGASSKAAAEAAAAAIQQALAAGTAAAEAGGTCLTQQEAAAVAAGRTSAAAAAGRSSCCGSAISLCSHSGDCSDYGAAAPQHQQQHAASMLGRAAAASQTGFMLHTGQLEQHLEGCATPTMADGRASVAGGRDTTHALDPAAYWYAV